MKTKQPTEQLIWEFDFSLRLGTGTVASIVAATVTPLGLVTQVTALTIGAQDFAGQAVRLRLDGGTDGERYAVAVRVLDSAGQTHELDAEFAVIAFGFDVPTIASPYLSAQAFVDRMGIDDAVRLTDVSGTGRIDVARLRTALADAQAEADGYLSGRFATPLATVPPLVTTIIYDLAVARLWRADLPQGVADAQAAARSQLRDIAKGTITLPGAALLTPAEASPQPVLFTAPERQFTSAKMAGF